jgi:hypothetical protein
MPASFTVNGSNTTITITITASTTNIQALFGIVCLYLWNDGMGNHGTPDNPIQFSSLTNQQKLDIFYAYIVKSVKSILLLDAREKSKVQNQVDADGYGL